MVQEPEEIPSAPPSVAEYAEACVRAVDRALGLRLDYSPDTISLLDHYLDRLPDRPRNLSRDPVRGLVATLAGVYFGEVARRLFPSRWVLAGAGPTEWRLELDYCLLTFRPVGVAWEVVLGRDQPGLEAAYLVDDALRAGVEARLDRLPPVTPEDYYTFAQRMETLVLTGGWLTEQTALECRARDREPERIPEARYELFLERFRSR